MCSFSGDLKGEIKHTWEYGEYAPLAQLMGSQSCEQPLGRISPRAIFTCDNGQTDKQTYTRTQLQAGHMHKCAYRGEDRSPDHKDPKCTAEIAEVRLLKLRDQLPVKEPKSTSTKLKQKLVMTKMAI